MIGFIIGSVIFLNIWNELAPSILAASIIPVSIPIMPAIRTIVVLPNHMRKFIRPMSPRLPHTVFKKLMGALIQPMLSSTAFTGPLSENSAKNMRKTAAFMAAFAKRLVEGDTIKDGKEEHYHGSGPAVVIDYSIPAAKRGIDMLLAKHAGRPFHTEVVMPNHEEIPVPVLTKPLSECKIGLVTDGGLVPKGNPDHQVPTNSKAFKKYSIAGMDTLKAQDWEVSHQGYNNAFVLQDPNRLVPVDALRKLVKAGVVGSMDDAFYSTAGVMTPMEKCKKFGEGIAKGLIADGCDAAIETST